MEKKLREEIVDMITDYAVNMMMLNTALNEEDKQGIIDLKLRGRDMLYRIEDKLDSI